MTWTWAWCCWNIPWIIGRDKSCGNAWKTASHSLFAPLRLHLLLLEEENAHVQYAAIRAIQVYAVNEEFVRRYRRQVLTLYGDWHSWWP